MFTLKFAIISLLYFSWTHCCQTRYNRKSPVLELTPLPPSKESALIWVKTHQNKSIEYWTHELDTVLSPYFARNPFENTERCNKDMPPSKDTFCSVIIDSWFAPCITDYSYGYNSGSPCIFLTLNEVPKGWTPQLYNFSYLPTEMPEDLKEHIRLKEARGRHQTVWVSCEGDTAADKENIGPVAYYPQRGFRTNFLLNTNVKGYLPPVVAVFFEIPKRGVVINVICTVWATNIPRDPDLKAGSIRFVLLVD